MLITTLAKQTKHLTMGEVVVKARVIGEAMWGNPHFPDAGPLLMELAARRNAMQAANVACLNGGRMATARRKRCRRMLEQQLDSILGYVRMRSAGDVSIALSSGFRLCRPPLLLPPLDRVQGLRSIPTLNQGRIELRWDRQHGVRKYYVYINTFGPDKEDGWRMMCLTSRAKAILKDMEPGRYIWFRVCAFSASGMSPLSQELRAMAC